MISNFFIKRPILAMVIAILSIVMGLIVLPKLQLQRFPDIAPPSIAINLSYPGASAQTLENSVAQVVEQQMTGLDGLLYFTTQINSDGNINFRFLFNNDVDPDVAQMQVQNSFQIVLSKLPEVVQKNGAKIRKTSEEELQTIAFFSTDNSMDAADVGDFVGSVLMDQIARVNGVGDVSLRGAKYAMRIWLDLNKLAFYKLNPQDIVNAIQNQNKQISVGQIGAMPSSNKQPINMTIKSRQLLESVDDFAKIIVKIDSNGAVIYLKDVATIELGRENYNAFASYNTMPTAALEVSLASGANAVTTANLVSAELEKLRDIFPEGLDYAISYDTVPFVKASLYGVLKTLIEALILVSLVILVFLRDIRSTLIVTVTIPVVIAITLVVLYFFNYSINTLTMFAMVLAIGLLVDDAIVVVENVNRLIYTQHLDPVSASKLSMQEISTALFGVGLVISAVFIPMSFFGGATGNIYRQFSVSIITSMLASIFVAIVITPALCAKFLKVKIKNPHRRAKKGLAAFFDSGFIKLNDKFNRSVSVGIHYKWLTMTGLVFISLLAYIAFIMTPTSFLPVEDQGLIRVKITMPVNTPLHKTQEVAKIVENYFLEKEKANVKGVLVMVGNAGFGSSSQSSASINVNLVPWQERDLNKDSVMNIVKRARAYFSNIPAKINVSIPGSIQGLGSASGFSVAVQNISGNSYEEFMQHISQIVAKANNSELLENVRYDTLDSSKQLYINIDDEAAGQLNLNLATINDNLEIVFGGKYVNDFIDRGLIKKVYVQASEKYRSLPNDLNYLYFKNNDGQMVNFSSFGSYFMQVGAQQLERFNGFASISLQGEPKEGVSSGQAMNEIKRIILEQEGNYNYSWSGVSYQENISGSQSSFLFAISALIVFLMLAALYESWSIPFSVILIVPIGILGALVFVLLRGLSNDIYLQIGLLTTGGLACKNAILIIEFASFYRRQGMTLIKAAKKAAAVRFRPIIMTSIAFLLGVLPLMLATGAGSESQNSIGTGVIGGTLFATVIGTFMIPTFFVVVSLIFDKKLLCRVIQRRTKTM